MRFGSGMQAIDHVPGYAIGHVSTVYDWASLGNAYIVNVGGSRGQAAIELASKFDKVKLLVQDSAMFIQGAESAVPDQLKDRVEFMKHELFEPQTVQADVYFFRMTFRTWDDKYAVQILKAHIPVLRQGVKILIQDVCMPEQNSIPLWRDRVERYATWGDPSSDRKTRPLTTCHRNVDMALKCFFNGRERHLDEWKALLAAADDRFVLHRVHVPEHSLLGMLEVHWDVPGTGAA